MISFFVKEIRTTAAPPEETRVYSSRLRCNVIRREFNLCRPFLALPCLVVSSWVSSLPMFPVPFSFSSFVFDTCLLRFTNPIHCVSHSLTQFNFSYSFAPHLFVLFICPPHCFILFICIIDWYINSTN